MGSTWFSTICLVMIMAAHLNFKRIKTANKRIRYSVYGYVRVNKYMLEIPESVIDIVLCFYYLIDEWDKKNLNSAVTSILLKNENCVQLGPVNSLESGSAYLTNIVSEGVFSWRFKIIQACNEMNFGITNNIKASTLNRFFVDYDSGYAWEAVHYEEGGYLMDPKMIRHQKLKQYGPRCKNGDVVEMILDLEQMTLRYKVNDIDYGVAFENIEKTQYKAAIFMYVYGKANKNAMGCIELLQ